MIFNIPHASTHIPRDVHFRVSREALARELLLMTDHLTDELFTEHAEPSDHIVQAKVSRLVVDTERFLDDDKETMAAIGMGVIYTATQDGHALREPPTEPERARLIRLYYQPHHQQLTESVREALERHERAVIIDCHSYPSAPLPYERDPLAARPDICLGFDPVHSDALPIEQLKRLLRNYGYTVEENTPFAGSIVPASYIGDERVCSLMFEIRRDLYMNEKTGDKLETFAEIQARLGEVLTLIRRHFGLIWRGP